MERIERLSFCDFVVLNLSETPVVDVEWSVSPILAQKKRLRQHPDDNEEKTDFVQSQYPKAAQITISDGGIRIAFDWLVAAHFVIMKWVSLLNTRGPSNSMFDGNQTLYDNLWINI